MPAQCRLLLTLGVFFLSTWLSAGTWMSWAEEAGKDGGRTWKYLSELSEEELELIDLSTNTPRHAQFPYLPAESYPFSPPYTAEEMGFRAMEFPHQPRWSCVYADAGGSIDSWGHLIVQNKSVGSVAYRTPEGLVGEVYRTAPGESFVTSISQETSPPERYGNQSLVFRYRVDKTFTKKLDMFIYTPSLRRVRRQPQPRRGDRFPNQAFTFDDGFGRDAWEWSWRIIGTDVLHQSVRFPNTRKTITLADSTNAYHEIPTSQVKMMGEDYKFYTPDGGVECYVVEARVREDWLLGYYAPRILYWLDKRYFYPLRVEEYDRAGKLFYINTRIAKRLNPNLGDQGYGMVIDLYWDMTTDLLTYSVHDGHRVKQWTEEDRKAYFNPDFMRRVWFVGGVKSQSDVNGPEEFFLHPSLDEGKFPAERRIELSPELRARIDAQEAAGRLVFSVDRTSPH